MRRAVARRPARGALGVGPPLSASWESIRMTRPALRRLMDCPALCRPWRDRRIAGCLDEASTAMAREVHSICSQSTTLLPWRRWPCAGEEADDDPHRAVRAALSPPEPRVWFALRTKPSYDAGRHRATTESRRGFGSRGWRPPRLQLDPVPRGASSPRPPRLHRFRPAPSNVDASTWPVAEPPDALALLVDAPQCRDRALGKGQLWVGSTRVELPALCAEHVISTVDHQTRPVDPG